LCVPNITPDVLIGIGGWTDGEVVRAIREGINRDDEAMFPIMPYYLYRKMADTDIRALVAYLRGLPGVEEE
jgi:hypothetical protein